MTEQGRDGERNDRTEKNEVGNEESSDHEYNEEL